MSSYPLPSATLTPEQEARVQSELQGNERVLWVGQPRPDLAARKSWFLVPFGCVFAGFAVFWILMAGGIGMMGGGAPGIFACFPLFGLPFVAVGVWMMMSPVWLRGFARRTIYAVTDRRALLWEPGGFGGVTLRSYTPSALGRMVRTENPDGSGDLIFEEFYTYSHGRYGAQSHLNRRGFLCVDQVRDVENLIRSALRP
jgi:hypothetical protein